MDPRSFSWPNDNANALVIDASTPASQLDECNALCESGEDTAFGKEASFLTPMKEGLTTGCSPIASSAPLPEG